MEKQLDYAFSDLTDDELGERFHMLGEQEREEAEEKEKRRLNAIFGLNRQVRRECLEPFFNIADLPR